MKSKVEAVNEILLKGEPHNISTDEHAGYTGYKPQAIIDAMNEVFWGEWGFSEVGNEIVPGEKGGLAVAQVQVWLAGMEFKPTAWGQNRVTRGDIGDAKKGAQTDGLKKALSCYSIGNRAYHGLLKVDDKSNQNGKTASRSPQNSTAPRVATQQNSTAPKLVLKWSDVYQKGAAKGVWTKEDFYPKASAILNGDPVNGNNVKLLSQEQLQKLHDEIEKPKPAEIAS